MSGQGGYVTFQGCVRIDGKPFVVTEIDGEPLGQLTPAEALNMGIRAIQAGQEAERDAAIVLGLKAQGMTDEQVAGLLTLIRDFRGQVDPDPRDDVAPPEAAS